MHDSVLFLRKVHPTATVAQTRCREEISLVQVQAEFCKLYCVGFLLYLSPKTESVASGVVRETRGERSVSLA